MIPQSAKKQGTRATARNVASELRHPRVRHDPPGTYALIGAASMLDGATRMVISLTVILLETTKNIQYLLPLTTTLMVSKFVGDFFNISIYEMVSSATPYPPCPELRMRTVCGRRQTKTS